MVFSSVPFLFYFLPLFLLAYAVTPGMTAKNAVLLAASLVFYAWGEPRFVLVLAAQIAINYGAALAIAAAGGRRRTVVTALAIAANLALLGVFKYADFAVGSLNALVGPDAAFALPGLALPLGISFFTFHSISYLIDIHRGEAAANRSLLQVAVYIAMFPQLVAGPIIRYHRIAPQLARRRMTLARAGAGFRFFIIGLAQKVLVADEVARIADQIFDRVASPSLVEAWLGLSAYTIQIYFDFAGYSNMAIGLGFVLGFAFPRNFDLPYMSRSITEFWRRWHISLSQWLRDYLYIPLGGSRGSAAQTYCNLWLVFVLCGLWHGANWTFVIWGVHHGLFLVVERVGLGTRLARAPAVVARLYLMAAVMTGWVWFRARDVEQAMAVFRSLVGGNGWEAVSKDTHVVLYPTALAALVLGALLAAVDARALAAAIERRVPYAIADTAAVGLLFVFSVLSVAAGAYSPFLYFRF
ncbi:MAG: MBOAT family O-acyltransferase [Xanthobacteraceae bacterium]|nr:MBOAT family O-acyltransferase [Xanthobacteraceae bacterium]